MHKLIIIAKFINAEPNLNAMKKNDILLLSFAALFVAVGIYLDFYIKLISIYWLVGKWIGLSAIMFFAFVPRIIRKEKIEFSVRFMMITYVTFYGLQCYRDITDYKENVCADKFGQEFNGRRRELHIPAIPKDWHFEYRYDRLVDWKGKSITGHERKSIGIDSNCNL
jgi:hypothetical protein